MAETSSLGFPALENPVNEFIQGQENKNIKNLETLPFYWWRFLKKRTRRENWERFRQSS